MNRTTKIILFSAIALFIAGMALFPTVKKYFSKEETPQETTDQRGPGGSGAPTGGRPAGGGSGGRGQVLNVNAKIIKPETLSEVFRLIAETIPDEEVDLSFESSGKITDIFCMEGSSVKKGQLLAKINDKPLQAELQKLQAQIPLAEARVFRQTTLYEGRNAVSQEAVEQVSTELDKLRADIELIKARIAQTELLAPFDGMIGLRKVSEGAYVTPSTVITTLTKIIPLKIEFSAIEKQAENVFPGKEISFQPNNDLNTYKATVFAKESRIDTKTYSLKVRALYPNTDGLLKPGRSGHAIVVSNIIENALTVPSESIIKEMGRDFVYVYSGGRAKQVELETGMRTEVNVQIINGLNAGDTLIITGVMQLRDGLPVVIDNIN